MYVFGKLKLNDLFENISYNVSNENEDLKWYF